MLLWRQVIQQATTWEYTDPKTNSEESLRQSVISTVFWDKSPHSILGYLCCVVVTGRKLPSVLQIIMTMKVIQWNRPAGTDSVCRDEAGNEHHASSKERCSAEQRWTEVDRAKKKATYRPSYTYPPVCCLFLHSVQSFHLFSISLFSPCHWFTGCLFVYQTAPLIFKYVLPKTVPEHT